MRWLGASLGIGLAQLAGCKALYDALCQRVDSAQAVCSMLLGQEMAAEEVARVFLAQPTLFSRSPELLQARLGCLQRELGLDAAAAALQLAVRHPQLPPPFPPKEVRQQLQQVDTLSNASAFNESSLLRPNYRREVPSQAVG